MQEQFVPMRQDGMTDVDTRIRQFVFGEEDIYSDEAWNIFQQEINIQN